jgi:predicted transposase/invertase (TIGR01784 family)
MLFTEYNEETALRVSFEEGKTEGLTEGEAKVKLETAKKMKEANEPIEKIVKFTDLPIEEIERL